MQKKNLIFATVVADDVMKTGNEYLAALSGFVFVPNNSSQPSALRPMIQHVTWSNTLNPAIATIQQGDAALYEYLRVVYDIGVAMLHKNQLLVQDKMDKKKEVYRSMLSVASLFAHASQVSSHAVPFDCTPNTLRALSEMCHGFAQEVAIMSAMEKLENYEKCELIGKLAHGAHLCFQKAKELATEVADEKWQYYLQWKSQCYLCLAHIEAGTKLCDMIT